MAFLTSLPGGSAALAIGMAAAGFWITVRAYHRLERRRFLMRQAEPCRRCGARN
jgi:hypothetical protein